MCDFRYPYTVGGVRVPYIGNCMDVPMQEVGCYALGLTGSVTFYWDGLRSYSPEDILPVGLEWRDEHDFYFTGSV